MIDIRLVNKAQQLKKTMDAAYVVFRQNPTTKNANYWTAATREFNDYCVDTFKDLIKETESSEHENILANLEKYRTCQQCGAEVLYVVGTDQYVTNVNFVEGFPGWCYDCLIKYCTTHDCESCTVSSRHLNCPFSEVKRIYTQNL